MAGFGLKPGRHDAMTIIRSHFGSSATFWLHPLSDHPPRSEVEVRKRKVCPSGTRARRVADRLIEYRLPVYALAPLVASPRWQRDLWLLGAAGTSTSPQVGYPLQHPHRDCHRFPVNQFTSS